MLLLSRRHAEWYDSFGHPPEFYDVQLPFGPKTSFVNVNNIAHQSDTSSLCGVFCLYVFYSRIVLHRKFQDIIHCDFNYYDKFQNDIIVSNFYNSICYCSPIRDSNRNCLTCKPRL